MARPGTVYRGGRRPSWIITLVVSILVILILMVLWLFYDLQGYLVYEKDGIRLAPQGGTIAPLSQEGERTRELPRINVEIVVDKTDYSDAEGTDTGGLQPLRGKFVPISNLSGATLNSYTYGTADYNGIVMELKTPGGMLGWLSSVPLADSYGVNGTLEIGEYVTRLKTKDLWMTAYLSCLVDSAMGERNPPAALRAAESDEPYTEGGLYWLDPYSEVTREYLTDLMGELKELGFDEILLTGMYLPADGSYRFGGDMTETPDGMSAVSSLAFYLREQADALGLRLSVVVEKSSLRPAEEGKPAGSQDLPVFFKAFDRVVYQTSGSTSESREILEAALDGGDPARIVPMASSKAPDSASYIVN